MSRDLDGRLSEREIFAVSAWLDTGQPIHSMRDHPAHVIAMLGDFEKNNVEDVLNIFYTRWCLGQ